MHIKNKLLSTVRHNKKLIQNILYVSLLRGTQLLLSLLSTYFVIRALDKNTYGEYHFILSCIGLLTIFSLKDMNNSIMQSVARGFLGTYRKAIPISLISNTIGSLILAVMSVWHLYDNQVNLCYGFAIAAILFPFAHGLLQWNSIHIGNEKFSSYFKHNSASLFVMYFLVIIGVLFYPGTLLIPLLFSLLIPSIQNVILTCVNLRNIPKDALVEDGNIIYGIKSSLYAIIRIVASYSDKLLLFYFLSPSSLATFVAAERVADLFRSIASDLSAVLGPKFATHERYTYSLDRYIKIFVFIYGALIIIFAFTGLPILITLLFGANYIDSIPYAQALLCSVAIGNLATLQFKFIRSQIDIESCRSVLIYTSLGQFIASVTLIPTFGILGAVLSAFIYRILLSVIVQSVIKKNYPMSEKHESG